MFDTSPSELALDPKHPGIHDEHYVNRRRYFFQLARDARLNNQSIPYVNYTEQEHEVWRYICDRLQQSHQKKASQIYLLGKQQLGLSAEKMPQLAELNQLLEQKNGMGVLPAEGLLSTKDFHDCLYRGIMPTTLFLRHHSNPEYTPEPDAVHDILGHIPPLMNKDYGEITRLIGYGVKHATPEQLMAWDKIYWFTIEFSLIEENNELKAFGAGLLSSFGEMEYCFSDNVERRPYDLRQIIECEYDPSVMQDLLFVIPCLTKLKQDIQQLITEFSSQK